jgi:hypothetical protein
MRFKFSSASGQSSEPVGDLAQIELELRDWTQPSWLLCRIFYVYQRKGNGAVFAIHFDGLGGSGRGHNKQRGVSRADHGKPAGAAIQVRIQAVRYCSSPSIWRMTVSTPRMMSSGEMTGLYTAAAKP